MHFSEIPNKNLWELEAIIIMFGIGAAIFTYVVCTIRADTKIFIMGNLFQTNFAKFGSKRV